jgi:hypothetical protein
MCRNQFDELPQHRMVPLARLFVFQYRPTEAGTMM